jgi:hypothetical protein
LVQLGVRAIPFGIAALVLTFIIKSAGTQADSADVELPGSGVSVFGTIHPELFRLRTPLGSGFAENRLQLASLDPQVGFQALASRIEMVTETPAPPCRNASLDERFMASNGRALSSDERTGPADDCATSFDDRFKSAFPVLASGRRSTPYRDVQNERAAAAKPILPRIRLFADQPRKEDPLLEEDDGHTAIYDITAHTVYLPSGGRLEAHSGLGELMDDPRHVHRKMRGPTPTNIYNLTLRERIFHGVRAIRLNPVDESRMHGRDGILAHTYMLGSNGASNGCVAFRNYPEFLEAFLKGEVTRLAVVDHLETPPGKLAAGYLPNRVRELVKATHGSRQYAAAGDH